MVDQIRAALGQLNALLARADFKAFKIGLEPPGDLVLLAKNARFMKQEIFQVLTEGIAQRGLSSLPLCWFDGRRYHVLSGNHRVQAAKAAGLPYVMFLYTDEEMTRQERVTIQLAHNQLTGQDDPQILKDLWAEIEDIGLKYLTGFDDDFFAKMEPVKFIAIKEPEIKFKAVELVFLEEDLAHLQGVVDLINKAKDKDLVLVAAYKDFDLFFQAVIEAKVHGKIINTATAIRKMAEFTLERLAHERTDDHPAAKGT